MLNRQLRAPLAALAAAVSLALVPAFAQGVDKPELESTADRKIEFINYEGPRDKVDSADQIRGLGAALGSPIAAGSKRSGDPSRYQVIHAVDPNIQTGFDADIVILGKGAGVDHIDSLRLILSGYLEKAYGYQRKDADTLAVFITIYNAVYRQQLDYYKSRYKPVVIGNIDASNAGLALRWDEWAGKSRVVIPLGAKLGGKGTGVSTGPVTESKVVKEMGKAPDKGVGDRRDMTDLKEREIKEGEKAVAEKKAEIEKEEKKIADEKAKIAEDKKKAGDTGTSATAADKGKDAEAGKNASGGATGTDIAKRESDVAKRETAVEEKKAEVARDEKAIAEKKAEVKDDRAGIAKDSGAAIKEEVKPGSTADAGAAAASQAGFLEALSFASPLSRIVILDLKSGESVKASTLNTIWTRTLVKEGDAYYCVAGDVPGKIRLASLDARSLETKATGADEIAPDSFLALQDGSLWAIVSQGGKFYLGCFGTDLKVKALSETTVHPFTAIQFTGEGVVVQRGEGGFAIVDKASLKTVKTLR